MQRRIRQLIGGTVVGVLALGGGAAPLGAQGTGVAEASAKGGGGFGGYRLELTSAWPELDASPGCGIGGGERLQGDLERVDPDRYVGTLQRSAELRFCGSHAGQAELCQATLAASGPVRASGAIQPEGAGLVLALTLTPIPNLTAVQVRGDCTPAFLDRLAALYRSAGRFLEIPVPRLGEAARVSLGLADYGWRVEVEGLAGRTGTDRRSGLAAE
jgi:hypothetical protein